jgi:hypothetical protein
VRGVRRAAAVLAALAALVPGAVPAAGDAKETSMQPTREKLPFGLTERELPQVKIALGHYPSRPGAGREEIWIRGDGTVTLLRTANYEAEPETREGKVPVPAVVALLALMEDERFLEWPELNPAKGASGRTLLIQLQRPDPAGVRQVAVAGEEFEGFAHLVGAVKALATSALPETLGERFFSNL